MSENKSVALVEFQEESHSKNAYTILNEYLFRGIPLKLEWAPHNIFSI